MQVSWLHISDFHIRAGDPYDRDVVLKALVRSVKDFRKQGRAPDLIFATGDIAYSGKPAEYSAQISENQRQILPHPARIASATFTASTACRTSCTRTK